MLDGRIVASGLGKWYGSTQAVDDVSFTAEPGRVTVLAGLTGAGKTTTLRMLVGLVKPSCGWATLGRRAYAELANPARVVGTVLEPFAGNPGRTGLVHLRAACVASGLPERRVAEVIDLVGLHGVAGHRLRGWPWELLQRLNFATALLGDPAALIVDDVAVGMDAAGEVWLCAELRRLAAEGRTILVATRTAALLEQLADDVMVLASGRLVDQWPVCQRSANAAGSGVSAR